MHEQIHVCEMSSASEGEREHTHICLLETSVLCLSCSDKTNLFWWNVVKSAARCVEMQMRGTKVREKYSGLEGGGQEVWK